MCFGLLTCCGPMLSSFDLISRLKLKMSKKQKSELFLKGLNYVIHISHQERKMNTAFKIKKKICNKIWGWANQAVTLISLLICTGLTYLSVPNTTHVQWLFFEQISEPSVNTKIALSRNSSFPDYPFLNIFITSILLLKKLMWTLFPEAIIYVIEDCI